MEHPVLERERYNAILNLTILFLFLKLQILNKELYNQHVARSIKKRTITFY
jgi:hypothetical protein